MRRKMAESVRKLYVCPFCKGNDETYAEKWKDIIDHMIKSHSDEEYWILYPKDK